MDEKGFQGFLIGSTFPLSLIRREVVIEPESIFELKKALDFGNWQSFWGHENTLAIASTLTGYDLKSATFRPVLSLNEQKLPALNGKSYDVCWILSPDYKSAFRPHPNVEVSESEIVSWQVLKMTWIKSDSK